MSNLLFLCNLLSLCQIRSIGNDSHPSGLCGLDLHGICSPVIHEGGLTERPVLSSHSWRWMLQSFTKVDAPVIHEGRLTDREISSVLFWSRVFPVSLPWFLSVAFFLSPLTHTSSSQGLALLPQESTQLTSPAPDSVPQHSPTFSSLQPAVQNHAASSPSTSKHVGQELVSWAVQNEPEHCVQVPLIFFCCLPGTRNWETFSYLHCPEPKEYRSCGRGSSLIRHSLAYCRFLVFRIHKDTLAHLSLFIWFLYREVKGWRLLTHYFRVITIKPTGVTSILLLPAWR